MPRPRGEPSTNWKLRLDLRLATAVDILTMRGGRPAYGERKRYVEALIARHLREIGWFDSDQRMADRRPLSEADIEAIATDTVERIF